MSIDTMNITHHEIDAGLNGQSITLPYSCDSVMLESLGATAGQVSFSLPGGKDLGSVDLAGGQVRLSTGPLSSVKAAFSGFNGLARLAFRAGGGGGSGDEPGPGPSNPWQGMKPITSIAALTDSIGRQTSSTVPTSASMAGDIATFRIPAAFPTGASIELRGVNAPVNKRGIITAGGAANTDVTARIFDADYTGDLTAIDAMGLCIQYAIQSPNGFFHFAAARSKKHPYIAHWGAQNGMTASQIISRIPLEVLPFNPSHAMFIMGANDLSYGRSNAEIIESFKTCATMCTAQGIQVLLFSITPPSEGVSAAQNRIEINAAVKEWCATQADVFYVDVHSLMADAQGLALPGVLYDAVHPTLHGYSLGAAPLQEVFERFAVDYTASGVNRIANAGFANTTGVASSFTGLLPTGCSIVRPSGATYTGTSSVENGEWTLDLSGGAAGNQLLLYLMPTEAASAQEIDSIQTLGVDVFVEADAEDGIQTMLYSAYYHNSDSGLNNANWFFNGPVLPGEWLRLTGRDIIVKSGDNFGLNRPMLALTVPAAGAMKVKVRAPGAMGMEPV